MRSCPATGKRRHRSRVEALLVLSRIDGRVRRSGQSDKAPVRAYPCGHCRGWHLTSQPDERKSR